MDSAALNADQKESREYIHTLENANGSYDQKALLLESWRL